MVTCLFPRPMVFLVLFTFAWYGESQAEPVQATSTYEFSHAFVDYLIDSHQIEKIAEREIAAAYKSPDINNQLLLSAVRSGTRSRLKLNVSIERVKNMRLADPNFEKLPSYLVQMYSQKADLSGEIVQAAQAMLAGPKPDVDYGVLAGHMPEVTAQIEYVNETIFKATPMVAYSLISTKPDSKNKLSHLSITRKQAQDLIGSLQAGFGKSLDAKDQNWTTAAASLLQTFLRDKGYKYLDEPSR